MCNMHSLDFSEIVKYQYQMRKLFVFFTVEVQRKSKPNLQNMKSYMSVDSEKSASASIKGSADDRSESIASQDCNKVALR